MMILFLVVMFLGSVQPIMMVVSLIFITLFYAYYMMMIMDSFWFSYAMIMVMLSGVFVIFIYMVSLIPNEEFEIYEVIFFFVFMFVFFVKEINLLGGFESEVISLKLWLLYVGSFMMFLSLVLFVVMLMVVWISCKNEGSLRVI